MARFTPFWLAAPSRFAALGKGRARFALLLLALLLAACLTARTVPDPAATASGAPAQPAGTTDPQTDLLLYEKIVAGMTSGAVKG